MHSEAREAVKQAKAAVPHLTASGTWDGAFRRRHDISDDVFESQRREFDLEQVATAIAFLRLCIPTKGAEVGSYGLKHAAENWGRDHGMSPYVANGELIAAAMYLGLNVKHDPGSPNVGVGVHRRCLAGIT